MSNIINSPGKVEGVQANKVHLNGMHGQPNGSVAGVGVNNVALPALQKVGQAASRIALQSRTARSSVNLHVQGDHLNTLNEKFEALEQSLRDAGILQEGRSLAKVSPMLNTITLRLGENGLHTIPYAVIEANPEVKAAFEDLKKAFFDQVPGNPNRRPVFEGDSKSNLKGRCVFSSGNGGTASGRSFIEQRLPLIAEGMSDERKAKIRERILVAERVSTKLTLKYRELAQNVQTRMEDPTVADEEKVALKRDLIRLNKEMARLQNVDPHALFWGAAFFPEEGETLNEQVLALEKAALTATGDRDFAVHAGSLLLQSREAFFAYFSARKMEMPNMKETEGAWNEVIKGTTPQSLNEELLKRDYGSDFVKEGITALCTAIRGDGELEVINNLPANPPVAGKPTLRDKVNDFWTGFKAPLLWAGRGLRSTVTRILG